MFAISVVLVAAIFVVDWLSPLDYVAWLSYLLPVFLVTWVKPRRDAYLLTTVCSLLIGMDLAAASGQPGFLAALVDGVASIVVLWVVVAFNGRLRRAQDALRQ